MTHAMGVRPRRRRLRRLRRRPAPDQDRGSALGDRAGRALLDDEIAEARGGQAADEHGGRSADDRPADVRDLSREKRADDHVGHARGGDAAAIHHELGDLLFQVVFHAQIAEERGEFSMADLLAALAAKMTRRHPHVFGDRTVGSAAEALSQWESIKQAESAGRRSVLHGGPRRLPGLLAAQHVQQRASRVGFDWSEPGAALAKESIATPTTIGMRGTERRRVRGVPMSIFLVSS